MLWICAEPRGGAKEVKDWRLVNISKIQMQLCQVFWGGNQIIGVQSLSQNFSRALSEKGRENNLTGRRLRKSRNQEKTGMAKKGLILCSMERQTRTLFRDCRLPEFGSCGGGERDDGVKGGG